MSADGSDHEMTQESAIQQLDSKFEGRFQKIESLLVSLVNNKRKVREEDSENETETSDGRDHTDKRVKRDIPETSGNDDEDSQQSEGEIIDDDSVSIAGSETDLLSELDKDLHEEEVTAPPVAESLAKLTNNRFQASMTVDKVKERMEKYPRPSNCTALVTPEVNKEIWKSLGKQVQNADIKLQHVQRAIVKAGMALAHSTQSLLRAQRSTGSREDIKTAVSQNGDAIALLGHASHELSLCRRANMKPSLDQGYTGLCSDKVQVTNYLFGDDLAGSIKEVQELNTLCSKIAPSGSKPKQGGKQYQNQGYYKSGYNNKSHFLGQGSSGHQRGRGRGGKGNYNKSHFGGKKQRQYKQQE